MKNKNDNLYEKAVTDTIRRKLDSQSCPPRLIDSALTAARNAETRAENCMVTSVNRGKQHFLRIFGSAAAALLITGTSVFFFLLVSHHRYTATTETTLCTAAEATANDTFSESDENTVCREAYDEYIEYSDSGLYPANPFGGIPRGPDSATRGTVHMPSEQTGSENSPAAFSGHTGHVENFK